MPFIIRPDCRCCQKAARNFAERHKVLKTLKDIESIDADKMKYDMWHDEDCWNKFHNGIRDKDYISKEDAIKQGLIKNKGGEKCKLSNDV